MFCCFNSSYKIGPGEFDVWMRILNKVEEAFFGSLVRINGLLRT